MIDPKALNLIKYECRNIPLCNYNSIFFYFYDFLIYESNIKLLMIVFLVILTLIFYIIASLFTKAFKISDIKINELEIPTGNPLIIDFDNQLKIQNYYYLDESRAKNIIFNQ